MQQIQARRQKPKEPEAKSQKPEAKKQKCQKKMPKKIPLQSKLPTYQSRTTECSGCIPGASSTVLEAGSTLDNDIVPGWLDLIASKKAGERSNQSGPLLQCHDLPSLEDP